MANGKFYKDEREFHGGLLKLYRHADAKKRQSSWYYRVKLPAGSGLKRYQKGSLKTPIEAEAIEKANQIFYELQAADRAGIDLSLVAGKRDWKTAWALFFEWKTKSYKLGSSSHTRLELVERLYLRPYFGKCGDINKITRTYLNGFWDFRDSIWLDGKLPRNAVPFPKFRTLQNECQIINNFFQRAYNSGLIARQLVLEMPKNHQRPTTEERRRDIVSKDQYKQLLDHTKSRASTARTHRNAVAYLRLRLAMMTIYSAGLRVAECRRLRWRDVVSVNHRGNANTEVHLSKGQTKWRTPSRVVVSANPHLAKLVSEFREQLRRLPSFQATIDDDSSLIFGSERDPYRSLELSDHFKKFAEELGMRPRKEKELRSRKGNENRNAPITLGSIRKTYITARLAEGIRPDLIALNCGNSVKTIWSYYNFDRATNHREELLAKSIKDRQANERVG